MKKTVVNIENSERPRDIEVEPESAIIWRIFLKIIFAFTAGSECAQHYGGARQF
jgi:hypothetical protein